MNIIHIFHKDTLAAEADAAAEAWITQQFEKLLNAKFDTLNNI